MTELPLQIQAVDPQLPPVGDTYRRLRFAGLTAKEAGTLIGRMHGLATVHGGWTIGEVERLLFVRELVRTGRIRS
jgi:hypothetical protein